MAGDAIVVEGVQRLPQLEHDVVRDVDDVVDRPLAERDQALLHPLGRRRDLDALDDGRQVAAAEIRRFDLDRCTSLDCRTTRFVVERWFAHGLAGQRCNFTGDTEDGQPVGTVRRDRELEDHVTEDVCERFARGRVGRQDEDAFVLFGQAELALTEHHAGGLDTTDHRSFKDALLAGIVAHAGTRCRKRHLLSGFDIRGAAHDGVQLAAADVNRGETEAIGVRMRLNGDYCGDADLATPRAAAADDRVNGEAGHREALRHVFRREAQVNIFAEPLKRDAHGVLELLQYPQVVLIEVAHVRHAV